MCSFREKQAVVRGSMCVKHNESEKHPFQGGPKEPVKKIKGPRMNLPRETTNFYVQEYLLEGRSIILL